MAVSRRSARPRFVLVLLILTSITLITLDQRGRSSGWVGSLRRGAHDVFAPVQSAADHVISPIGNFFSGIFDYGHLKSENARLRRDLDQARSQSLQYADAVRERGKLERLAQVGFAGDLDRTAVIARVVDTTPSNFELTIEIDKGSAAGIARGMPVVTDAGLVGRVVDASKQRATVLLVTDPQSNVGIRFPSSNDVGVAKGAGAHVPLPVDFVDLATTIGAHEVVVTSGLEGSIFPPGIPVGQVHSATTPKGALQQNVTLDPVVDFAHLDFVKILRWLPPSSP